MRANRAVFTSWRTPGGYPVEGGVGRQLHGALDEQLQSHVDKVRRVVLHLRRLADGLGGQRPGLFRVERDAHPLTHDASLVLGASLRPRLWRGPFRQPQAAPEVFHHGQGDLVPPWEVPQALEAFHWLF